MRDTRIRLNSHLSFLMQRMEDENTNENKLRACLLNSVVTYTHTNMEKAINLPHTIQMQLSLKTTNLFQKAIIC